MSKTRKTDVPLTEIVDAQIPRIDLVDGPANGNRFLIAKRAKGKAGIVSTEMVKALAADEPGDVYIDASGGVINGEVGAPAQAIEKHKENPVATPAAPAKKTPAVTGDVKAAKAVLKQAAAARKQVKLAKKTAKLQKRAVLAEAKALLARIGLLKGTLGSLSDAHKAILDALQNEAGKGADGEATDTATALQGMANKLATLMSAHAAAGGEADDAEPDDGADDGADGEVAKTNLRKARKSRKAAKCNKQIAKYSLDTARMTRKLRKIGARNSKPDQGLIDTADSALGNLGATFHVANKPAGVPVAKSAIDTDGIMALVSETIGRTLPEAVAKAVGGDLTQMREQVAKIAAQPLPGGPRFVTDRDGSYLPVGDGQQGMTPEVAALRKAAEQYPAGSAERDKLERKAAAQVIKSMMAAQ